MPLNETQRRIVRALTNHKVAIHHAESIAEQFAPNVIVAAWGIALSRAKQPAAWFVCAILKKWHIGTATPEEYYLASSDLELTDIPEVNVFRKSGS